MTRRVKHERYWKDEEIETLIGLYEERVCLWDFGSEEYINKDGKDLAYEQIDEEMKKYNISREEYKSKWKGLRGQFMREKDGERKKKSGQASNEVYVSKWKWFQHLKFLATINTNVSHTKGYDTMNKASTSCVTVEDTDEIATVKTPKKMRGEVEKKKMLVLDKAVGILNEHNKTTEPKQLTEEEHFGMLVAKTLARLSGRNKLITQKKISHVLFEAEIQATANQENGQFGFTDLSYNQQYRGGEQYLSGFQKTFH